RRLLQAQCMRIGKHVQGVEVDRAQFIAQVAKAVMKESPGCRGLSVAGLAGQQIGLAAMLECGGVKEQQIRSPFLQSDRDVLFQMEEKPADVGGGNCRLSPTSQRELISFSVARDNVLQVRDAPAWLCN